ncbi:MFS transporter [Nonomuraea sp. NPDC059194]|uniref:MFS transporter n=1 Tax=Nonomuraea sp. NPDC059194 TaxID=3346764 RepID=UPI0036BF017B
MNPLSRTRRWAALATLCLAVSLIVIDGTVLHLAIPSLTEALRPSSTQVLWIADIYGFVLGGLLITAGNAGDRFGRKRVLLAGVTAFGLASLATAYAPNPELLIVARAVLGVAGATIMPSTLSIIRNIFTDPRERTTAIGLWSAVTTAGAAAGPLLGGLLLDTFWWGSVFLINVPVMAVVLIVAAITLPESRNPDPGPMDVPSVLLSIVGVIGVIYAVKEAAHTGLVQTGVLAAAVVGLVALTAFWRRQTRLTHPLIDVRLFRRRAFSGAVGGDMIAVFALVGTLFFLSLHMQFVLGWTPLQAGLAQLPAMAASTVAALVAGRLAVAWTRAVVISLGLGLSAAGLAVLVMLPVESGYPVVLGSLLLIGVGAGLSFTVTADTVIATVPKERAGSASAIAETAYELGAALGIALLGSLLGGLYRQTLRLPGGLPDEAAEAARDSIGTALQAAAELPAQLAEPVVAAASQAFVHAVQITSLIGGGLVAVVAVLALFTLRGLPTVVDEHSLDSGVPLHTRQGADR